jgi:CDP-paratose 2-epimerase
MKRILVIGGSGFVGCNLALYLSERGYLVTVLDNLVRRGSELNLPLFKTKGITFTHGDIRCKEDFETLPNFDVICEISAQPSAVAGYANPYFDFTNNTVGVMNVLEFARKRGSNVILWSTNKVYSGDKINSIHTTELNHRYDWSDTNWIIGFDSKHGISEEFSVDGGQHSIYGLSKIMSDLAVQEYAHAFNVKTVVNRFSCIFGPRQWGVPEQGWATFFVIAAYFNLPITYYGWKGKQVRDMLFIDDVCRLVETEIEHIDEVNGEVFNIGGGYKNTLSLLEATALLEKMLSVKMNITTSLDVRKADHCVYITDIRKVKEKLRWVPTIDVVTGYEKILRWVRDNEDILERMYT